MLNTELDNAGLPGAVLRAAYKVSGGKAGEIVTCEQIAQHVRIPLQQCREIIHTLRAHAYIRTSGDDTCVVINGAGFEWVKAHRFPPTSHPRDSRS